jgi:subtilisin
MPVGKPRSSAMVPPQPTKVPTFGLRRIGGLPSPAARFDGVDQRMPVDIAFLDTGIEANHPDLDVRGGKECVGGPDSFTDVAYHGTAVAAFAARHGLEPPADASVPVTSR